MKISPKLINASNVAVLFAQTLLLNTKENVVQFMIGIYLRGTARSS
jgi:hypothetical protein